MSSYASMGDIARAIADKLTALNLFDTVVVSDATTGEKIADALDAMTSAPSALVAFASVEWDETGLARVLRPMIFITADVSRSPGTAASSLWNLTERVAALFLPAVTGEGISREEARDIDFRVRTWSPVEFDESVLLCSLTLEGTEFLSM